MKPLALLYQCDQMIKTLPGLAILVKFKKGSPRNRPGQDLKLLNVGVEVIGDKSHTLVEEESSHDQAQLWECKTITVDRHSEVTVPHVEDGGFFYVRHCQSGLESLEEKLSDIECMEELDKPAMGKVCLTAENKRAIIVAVLPEPNFKVILIDYGQSAILSRDQLYRLPPEFAAVPPLAQRCRFFGLKIKRWTPSMTEAVKILVDKAGEDFKLFGKVMAVGGRNGAAKAVHLKDDEDCDVVTYLVESFEDELEYETHVESLPTTNPQSSERILFSKDIPEASGPFVFSEFTQWSNAIIVTAESRAETIKAMKRMLQNMGDPPRPEQRTLHKEMMVLVKEEGKDYHRASVEHPQPVKVRLVDNGQLREATPSELFVFPPEMAAVPKQSRRLELFHVQKILMEKLDNYQRSGLEDEVNKGHFGLLNLGGRSDFAVLYRESSIERHFLINVKAHLMGSRLLDGPTIDSSFNTEDDFPRPRLSGSVINGLVTHKGAESFHLVNQADVDTLSVINSNMKALEESSRVSPGHNPAVGEVVIVRHKKKDFFRGVVLSKGVLGCECRLVDVGKRRRFDWGDVHPLPAILDCVPFLAHECRIVTEDSDDTLARAFFLKEIREGKCDVFKVIRFQNGIHSVEIGE